MEYINNYEALQPAGPDFREAELPEAFTWMAANIVTGPKGKFAMGFYSDLDPETREDVDIMDGLTERDRAALASSRRAGGLDLYRADDGTHPDGKGLSLCIWESPEAAYAAIQLREHVEATNYVKKGGAGERVYRSYRIKPYIIVRTGLEKSLEFYKLTRGGARPPERQDPDYVLDVAA